MLAGFGPYVAVYLAEQKWTQENIGFVLTASGLATRHEGKQAGETARGEDEADILLSPFLLGQINGYIGTETSQHGRIEKIDSVKTVQARTRWRGFSSMGQRHNESHLLTVLSNQTREPL